MCFKIGNASGVMCQNSDDLDTLYTSSYCSFVVTKSATLNRRDGNPEPRYATLPNGSINSSGLPNHGFNFYLDWAYDKLTNENKLSFNHKKKIYLSISGLSLDDNVSMIKSYNQMIDELFLIEDFDINLIPQLEINLSCPNVIGKPQIGYDLDNLEKYIRVLDKEVDNRITYGFKLPPYFDISHFEIVSNILNKFDKCSFIVCCNSLGNGLFIDIAEKEVVIKPKEGFGGIGGDYILPTSLANVNYFYKNLKGKEIVGCGGIKDYNTCLMHIYAGASRLQVGTYLYENDAEIFGSLKSDLYSYIWKNNLGDIKELIGCVKSKN